MNLPELIRIGPYDIKILPWEIGEANGEQSYGQFNPNTMTIKVATGYQPAFIVDTLLHEILHAASYVGNIGGTEEENEETYCTVLATQLTQVFRDNPQLLKFITQQLKK